MNAILSPPAPPRRVRARIPDLRRAPADTAALLLESLPHNLVSALGELPRRLLFTNASLSLLLVGLSAGQVIRRLRTPVPVLLTVAFGRAAVVENDWRFDLTEGQQWTLEPQATYDLEANDCVDLLLLLPADAARSALPARFD